MVMFCDAVVMLYAYIMGWRLCGGGTVVERWLKSGLWGNGTGVENE